jgi:hypothetical protein
MNELFFRSDHEILKKRKETENKKELNHAHT